MLQREIRLNKFLRHKLTRAERVQSLFSLPKCEFELIGQEYNVSVWRGKRVAFDQKNILLQKNAFQ